MPKKKMTNDILYRPLADITESIPGELNLTPLPNQMPELESKLRAILDEANAAGAFASVGSVPVEGGIKLEFYFTLRVPAPKPQPTDE